MRYLPFYFLVLLSCSTDTDRPMGHWHEIKYGETIHCYQISETIVSVDKFTFGYSRKVTNKDIYQSMVINSTFGLLKNESAKSDRIIFGDSILWVKVPNESKTFITDLAIGLLLKVQPPESVETELEVPHESVAPKIYIGQLKDSPHDRLMSSQYYIQLNEAIASVHDIGRFLSSLHGGYENRMVILHADRNTPQGLLNAVVAEIIRAGYADKSIYRTVINSNQYTMGLIRSR